MSFSFSNPSGAFRQSTIYQLRWIAIVGQLITIIVAHFLIGLEFNILACVIVISLWALLNIMQQHFFVDIRRLNARVSFWSLVIDLGELTVILMLTGGLNNPFASLLIVPTALAATSLADRDWVILVLLGVASILILAQFYQPIYLQGEALLLPELIGFGVAVALIVLILFLSYFTRQITLDNLRIQNALAATELALQREQRLSSLGALVAAYAHELGTPLATIRLAANELLNKCEVSDDREDLELILGEAKRSAEILNSMGERGKADEMVKIVPMMTLIEEAAAPHIARGKDVSFLFPEGEQIFVERSEALIQAVRNLVQNAVDHAKEEVLVELDIDDLDLVLRVEDDGDGFPPEDIDKLGEPYIQLHQNRAENNYRGMGLGIFIAKTLLERTNARIQFSNIAKEEGGGALVKIIWPREELEVDKARARAALAPNSEAVS